MVKKHNKSIFPTKVHSTTGTNRTPSLPKSTLITEVAGTVVQGMAFGTGSSLGHRAVSAIFDNSSSQDKCAKLLHEFNECINKNTAIECEYLLHKYKDCQP